MSDFINFICGVPQGSVLARLKCCLYVLSLNASLIYHKIGYNVYGDDTHLYIYIYIYISVKCKQPLEAISKLNSCLADIRRWMITNKLTIRKQNLFGLDLHNWSVIWVICQSMMVKVWLHNHEGWEIWESYSTNFSTLMIILLLCRITHFHIRNIGKIKNLLSYNACSTIIHALISCRLDYCNSILYNFPRSKTDRLRRLQNKCARILTE